MDNVISIIIPVYNVATYLSECLDSVLSQDYEALEILLIDDGSTDDSGVICDKYAEKDSRIRVVHQPNGGAAAAKNTGLQMATGEYLAFLDSDDYLEKDAYSHMMRLMHQYETDVVQCRIQYVFRNGTEDVSPAHGHRQYSGKEYIGRYIEDWTCGLMTDKLYKRCLYDGVFFEEGHVIDDEFFTYQGIMNANKIICDDRIIYNYRVRRSSVMRSPELKEQRLLDCIDFLWKRRNHVIARFPEYRRLYNSDLLANMIGISRNVSCTEKTISCIKDTLKMYFRDENRTLPERWSWLPLLFLRMGSVKSILRRCYIDKNDTSEKTLFP